MTRFNCVQVRTKEEPPCLIREKKFRVLPFRSFEPCLCLFCLMTFQQFQNIGGQKNIPDAFLRLWRLPDVFLPHFCQSMTDMQNPCFKVQILPIKGAQLSCTNPRRYEKVANHFKLKIHPFPQQGKKLSALLFIEIRGERCVHFWRRCQPAGVAAHDLLLNRRRPARRNPERSHCTGHGVNGLYGEIRLFSVPSNLSIPVGTPTNAASWHTEGATVPRTKAETASVTFTGRELIKVMSMSAAVKRMEIAAFERYIADELKNSIMDAIGVVIVSGTGTGQPTGILPGVTWSKKNAISTTKLTADNLLTAVALLLARYSGGAKFAMSVATLFGTVYPIKNKDEDFLFTDTESGGNRRIFGFPVVLDDNIPAGTVFFGNFRYYGVNIPQGIAVEVSRESGFTSGLIDFRALCIADGKPIVPGAFVKVEVSA